MKKYSVWRSRLFWRLTRHQLRTLAVFDEDQLRFELGNSPLPSVTSGHYALIRKGEPLPEGCHLYRLSHPLGEYVLDTGRRLDTAPLRLIFLLTDHPAKISALEPYIGKTGWLELNQLELDSFQREEHLVFTAVTDDGKMMDHELCQQLFQLSAESQSISDTEAAATPIDYLTETAKRQLDSCLSRALDDNNQYFQRERDKLDAWAHDQTVSAEAKLDDTRAKLREAKKQARLADTVEAQKAAQEEVKKLEKHQRRQRQDIFDVEDAIEARRDSLIEALEKQMHRRSSTHHLFRIRWQVQ